MGILGSIGKFLVGGSKQTSQQKQNVTTNTSPWSAAEPFLRDLLNDTNTLYHDNPMFSPMEQSGYGMLSKTVGQGPSSYFNTSADTLESTARGDYLTPDTNPYLADIAKRVSGIAGANSASMFGGRGRSGGGLAGYFAGKAVGDSLTDMYGSVYESERGRQQNAAGMAPSFEEARLTAPKALISAGQNITARPYDLNQQRTGILSQIGGMGGTSTSNGTTTNFQNNPGLLGNIVNSFTNKLFPKGGANGGASSPW